MTRTAVVLGSVLVALALLSRIEARGGQEVSPPQTMFRSSADLVLVDVSVEGNGGPVTGLTASDFRVTDSGVAQRVESVDPQAMPLDVTVIEDLSYGTRSPWKLNMTPEESRARVNRDLAAISALLRSDDRIRLLAIDTYVQQVLPMQAPAALSVPVFTTDGWASLYDALVVAMLRPVDPTRRHLIIAGLGTSDPVSAADAVALRDVARQSDAVLHVVRRDASQPGDRHNARARPWQPFRRGGEAVLQEAATLTGGTFHPVGVFGGRDLVGEFEQIVGAFRSGYAIRYVPQGIARSGWHEIVVSVPGAPTAIVRARRGYAIEPVAPPRDSRRPAAAADATSRLEDLVDLFDRGDDAAVQLALRRTPDLRRTIREYREGGTPWPGDRRRDAVFVLELVEAGLAGRDAETRDEAFRLLRAHEDLVRPPIGVDTFECAWHAAATSILEGALRAGVALETIDRQLARCPTASRLHLARALASDQLASTTTARAGVTRESLAEVTAPGEVLRRYEEAMTYSDVAAEARVRAAWLAYRTRQPARALEYLDAPLVPADNKVVQYYDLIVRGHALRALGRLDEAIAAFREALVAWPGAQTARVGLMTSLVTHGDRREGEALAEAVQTASPTAIDPWWLYWQGSYRHFGATIADLRRLAK